MHKALLLLKKIPSGKVVSYKELARVCGTSPRAIGRVMAHNQNPKEYPCYKVVASSGELGGYSGQGGLQTKRTLLERDGISLENGKVPSHISILFPFQVKTWVKTWFSQGRIQKHQILGVFVCHGKQ